MFDRYRRQFLSGKTRLEEWSDEALVEQFRKSADPSMLAELFKRYTSLVFGVCMKYLEDEEASRDAVMDIFEFLSLNLSKYEIGNFRNWLYSVSRNHCMMIFREEKKEKQKRIHEMKKIGEEFVESGEELNLFSAGHPPDETERLKKALMELDPGQKTCIELMYLSGKSYREISEITGFSMNQVKSYIQNGKRNLKLMLNRP